MHLINHLQETLSNTSVVIKASIVGIAICYIVGLIPGAYPILSITPTLLLPPNFQIWTLATGLLVEGSIVNVLVDVPVLLLCGLYLEPLWGALELLKYFAITGIGSSLLTSFVSLLAYVITRNYSLWFVQFSGISGILGGIGVAFKQINPDQVINLKYHSIRVKDVPFLCMFLWTCLALIRVFSYTQPVMLTCGIFVGWVYLRFYQTHGKNIRGDMSENFDLASIFPPVIRPVLRALSTLVFGIMVKLGLCKHPVRTYDVGAPTGITISLPGSDPADAERRRKKALRALNERLSKMQVEENNDQQSDGDDIDDNWVTIQDEIENIKKPPVNDDVISKNTILNESNDNTSPSQENDNIDIR